RVVSLIHLCVVGDSEVTRMTLRRFPLLAAAFLVFLAACGSQPEPETTTESAPVEQPAEAPAEAPAAEEAPAPAEEPVAAVTPPPPAPTPAPKAAPAPP